MSAYFLMGSEMLLCAQYDNIHQHDSIKMLWQSICDYSLVRSGIAKDKGGCEDERPSSYDLQY